MASIAAGSRGTLIVDGLENIGPHYARTLRLWRQKFLQNFDARIAPALRAEHHAAMGTGDVDLDLFRRKWEYYFSYSEAGFATKTLGDVIITAAREGAVETMEGVAL